MLDAEKDSGRMRTLRTNDLLDFVKLLKAIDGKRV